MTTKSGKHANKIVENALSSAAKNGAAKAVDMRKVAALSAGAAGVIAGAAIAFGATPAMAAEATSTPVKTTEPAKEQELTANKKKAEAKDEAAAEGAKKTEGETASAEGSEASDSKKAKASKVDSKVNENKAELAGDGAAKVETNAAEVVNQQSESGKAPADSTTANAEGSASADANEQGAANENSGAAKRRGRRALPDAQPTDEAAGGEDRSVSTGENRAATPAPAPKVNSEITLSQDKKDTLPNMYAWGKSDNVYIENGQNQKVTFNFAAPTDGSTITKVAIFPSDTNGVDNAKSRGYLEYYSADANAHQSYSGTYDFKTNTDGSATLTMSKLYREGRINGAQGYAANRCIYVYGTKDGKTVLLYKTNVARAATLIPPKNAGSIVLKYNEELTAQQIQDKLKAALDAPTEATGKKSVSQQIVAASTASKVGARTGANGAFVQTPDDPEKKVVITDKDAYDTKQVSTINTVTSKPDAKVTTYKTGAQTLDTHLISDLGYKSEALPLTVARYDTHIDKPIVEDTDPSKVSDEVKAEIKKKLARLNHVSEDKVTIGADGQFTINFDGVDPNDAPKIPLRDLVLKKIEEKDITVPAADKAVFVANPLGYSSAELDRIKTAIFDANKDNPELGLTSKDQITLSYITSDLVNAGDANKGRSNGLQENNINVTIKTDKALAKFTSDIIKDKLTRLPDIRTDYNVELVKNKLDGRDSDEGFSWSDDKHTTLIYRYDPTKAQKFTAPEIVKLIKATPKDQKTGLRTLTGGEALDHEGAHGKPRKSHMNYSIDENGEPTTELTLGMMNGAYWIGDPIVANSDANMGDEESKVGKYTWDDEAGSVTVAAKQNKVFKTRLFVAPYALTYYRGVYTDPYGKNPNNTPKAINVIFVPQTNHKTKDLNESIGEHKTVAIEGKDVPTQSAYYNASDKVKKDYEDALKVAKQTLEKVGTTPDDQLSEQLKAEVDNATIKLNKARAALDGPDTNKEKLKASIDANGKAAEGQTAATGTQATDRYKNVTNPDFKTADGKPDDAKNNAAKEAKKAYDEALAEANKVNSDDNATQKAVDDAKAKLDAARAKLNDFTTNKDKLNAAFAEYGHVNTGDAGKTGDEKLKTADPTYQNSTPEQRKAYDDAVAEAKKVVADPNASQKEVNAAIEALKKAKEALDAKATNKSQLEARLLTSLDHVGDADNQKSVFYKNGKDPNYFADTNTKFPKGVDKEKAKKYADEYDDALAKAKEILNNKGATQKQVDEALAKLKEAEDNLHKLQSDANDLVKTLADNFTGYLLPAYFNAFDKAQAEGKDSQAAKDFKAYNDAYHAAKKLQTKFKDADPAKRPTQKEIDNAQAMLEKARKVIDSYATDTSKLSVAILNDVAIQKSPAYNNAKALADKQNPEPEEQAQVDAAKKAVEAYQAAMKKIQKAFENQMEKDQKDGQEIPADKAPDADGDTSSPNYLDGIQSHAKGQPLNKDVTDALADFNKAREGLNAFATKTDELIKSVNEDDATKQTPAYKNTAKPEYKGEDGTTADTNKNNAAKQAHEEYGKALKAAKDLLKDPNATQAQIDEAKKNLDNARKALDTYNTDTAKLKASVDKHGSTEGPAATEGTQTSDAYRNASDPHFLTADGKPDTDKNAKAAAAKKAYDEALTKAQELLKKHDDKDTPQDAKPTQKDINDALDALDKARTKLDAYKTDTTKLEEEANKSTAEGAPAVTENDFENTPEFQNADAKKKDGADGNKVDNDDVKAYKDALAKARKLAQDNTSKTLSDHHTQKEIDDALEALKKAKQAITDGYKTDVDKLKQAKEYAEDVFKKTPEYKNATAIKADVNNAKHDQAGKDLGDATKQTGFEGQIAKIAEKLNDTSKLTQREVDALVNQLKIAQNKIADNYKTNVDKLNNEVGDKDQDGKPVVPPFEASVAYKNATAKSNAGDATATEKLKAYADKLQAAQELINKVNNPDPNAEADSKPTQKDVDDALAALKKAKQDIDDNFKTKVDDLQKEVDDKDDKGNVKDPTFENTTEFANLKGKTKDGKKHDDLVAYEKALANAKELIKKNTGKMTDPQDPTKEVDVPKDQLPTQKEVDEAQKALKEIKEKILANHKTSPVDLQKEVDLSKDDKDKDDKRDGLFEDSPAFKNAQAKKGDDGADNADMKAYKDALEKARKLLDAFDRTTGKPKDKLPDGMTQAPTQKQLDDALKALQDAKKKIEKDYATQKGALSNEAGADDTFRQTPEFQNAVGSKEAKEYEDALAAANSVLGDKNATQAQVDAALKRLQDAKAALRGKHGTDKSDLRNEAENDPTFRDSIPFLIANSKDIAEYNEALNEANAVLADPTATQAQVDAALRKLRLAKQKIMDFYNSLGSFGNGGSGYVGTGFGVGAAAVDKSMLIVEVNGALADIANGVNANASADAANAAAVISEFNAALQNARAVLANPNATQAQVDAALNRLRAARAALAALNAADADRGGSSRGSLSVQTGVDSATLSAFAAMFVGLAGLGVSAKRRKHASK